MSATRQFIDSFGFSWQVCEISATARPSAHSEGLGDGWLYFFCRGTTRVLPRFPRDWESRSWTELEELCGQAALLGADRVSAVPAAAVLEAR